MRRRTVVILLMAGLVASACGAVSPESLAFAEEEPRRERTIIRIATYSRQGLTDAIEQWEREHPTAEVVVEVRPSEDHHALMLEREVNSTTPDIVVYDTQFTTSFRNRTDLLLDVGELGAGEFESEMLPWRWAQGVADDGTIVGLPTDVGGLAVAYRTDLLGPNLSRRLEGAASWCDLIELGDEYSDRTNRPFMPNGAEVFEAVLNQAPLRFYNRELQMIHSTNPAVLRSWDLAMRAVGSAPLFEEPCPDAAETLRFTGNTETLTPEWEEAVAAGEFAALLAPAWLLETIQSTAPATGGAWRLTSLPGTGAGNRGGSQLAVHASTSHPELAYDLIAHLADPTTQLRAFRDFGTFPSAESLYTDRTLVNHKSEFFGDSAVGQIYIDSVQSFRAAPEGEDNELILAELRSAVARVEAGSQSAQEAWDEALWRIELFLD